jgi:hypothetical protein
LRFVVGRELGHALSGRAVYRTILMHLIRMASSFGFTPIGAALLEWQRKCELSGRAGLRCAPAVAAAGAYANDRAVRCSWSPNPTLW